MQDIKNNFFLKIKHFVFLLVLSAIVGYLLLIFVYLIPSEKLIMGCANSICTFQREDLYPILIDGYPNTQLDNFTDAAMLNTAICSIDEAPYIAAVKCSQYRYNQEGPMASFMNYIWGESCIALEYSRYWNGFLVILKPLLVFFSYADIRMLNGLMQMILGALFIWLLVKKQLSRFIIPFILTIFYLVPIVLAMSLQNSSVFYIAIIASIILLKQEDILYTQKWVAEFFLILGILTSYFDLLTYPIITLGFPLVLFVILMGRREIGMKKIVLYVIGCSISWGIGYLGMWSAKWVLSILVLGTSSLEAVINSLNERSLSGAVAEGTNVWKVIKTNLDMYKKPIYRVMPAVMLFLSLIYVFVKKIRVSEILKRCIPFLLIILIPFAWYTVTANHAAIHAFFTHRTLSVAALSFFCMVFDNMYWVHKKNE